MAGWSGAANDILKFLGTPIIALAVGTIFGVIQLVGAQRLFRNGYSKIVLDTNLTNTRAQHVYESLGFRKVRTNMEKNRSAEHKNLFPV